MISSISVFGAEQGADRSYRIPALLALPDGGLCAFCEARSATGGDWEPMSLSMRRRGADGEWSEESIIAVNEHGPVHNPAPFISGGEVHLLYGMDYARFYHVRSRDGGRSFDAPQDITYAFESFRGRNVPGGTDWHCIAAGPGGVTRLESGRIVAPVWIGGLRDPHSHDPCQAATIYSDDGGWSWRAGEVLDMFELGPSESQAAALPLGAPAQVVMSLRNRGAQRRRAFAWSQDGAHWTRPRLADDMTEINCQGSLIRRGNLLLATSPQPEGDALMCRERRRLTLKVSRDWGRTWSRGKVLVEGTAGYSALALDGSGRLLCMYETWEDASRMRLELLTITADEFEDMR